MKKVFFVVVFTLITTAVFAQLEEIYTSEGVFYVPRSHPSYIGQNCGQEQYLSNIEAAREMESLRFVLGLGLASITPNIRLSKGQLECVQRLLSRYETARGDTFFIRIMFSRNGGLRLEVYCEFTSNTEYRYWAYSSY